ncbi:MAG: alginate export family protein [Bacteroidales bacterium]|nr:alginate export family protein [Bacteroidales bacterium]
MKRMRPFFACLCLFLMSQATAQDFSLSAELRPRMEYRDGYQKPLTTEENPALFISNRTRLRSDFESKWINARLTIQDARVWGQDDIKSSKVGLNFFEAWAELNVVKNFSFTIGRQSIMYDYKRLFDVSDWTLEGKSHDLALLKYKNDSLHLFIDLGFAYNATGENNTQMVYENDKLYQSLGFLHLEKSFCKAFKASAIFVGESFQNLQTDSLDNTYIDGHYGRYTAGANLEMKHKDIPVSFILTGYYQFGQSIKKTDFIDEKTIHQDLRSFLLAAKVDYQIIKPFGIGVGVDYYSGSEVDATSDNTWNKLYGTNHSYNGSMEYWRNTPNEGLIDLYGGVKTKFCKKVSADLTYHYFMTEKNIQTAGTEGKSLGSELDLIIKYDLIKFVRIEGGWSTYFNSKNTKLVKNIADDTKTRFQQWAYVSLKINPQLFNTKNHKKS